MSEQSTAIAKVNESLAKATKPGTLAGLKHTQIQDVLCGMKQQINMALPRHLDPDRMIQIVATELSRNERLKECTVTSLIGAVMQASILGFSPASVLGECYFVPYGGQVQFQIGYKGYKKLARQSGQISQLYAECVYKGDTFEYSLGLDKNLIHKPDLFGTRKDEDLLFVYAVAKYKDGTNDFVVLTKTEVEKLRLRNTFQKAIPDGAWKTDYSAMAKAKAVKQLAKWLPLQDTSAPDDFKKAAVLDEAIIPVESMNVLTKTGADLERINIPQLVEESIPEAVVVKEEPKPAPVPVKTEPAFSATPAPAKAGVVKKEEPKKVAPKLPEPGEAAIEFLENLGFAYDEARECYAMGDDEKYMDIFIILDNEDNESYEVYHQDLLAGEDGETVDPLLAENLAELEAITNIWLDDAGYEESEPEPTPVPVAKTKKRL